MFEMNTADITAPEAMHQKTESTSAAPLESRGATEALPAASASIDGTTGHAEPIDGPGSAPRNDEAAQASGEVLHSSR